MVRDRRKLDRYLTLAATGILVAAFGLLIVPANTAREAAVTRVGNLPSTRTDTVAVVVVVSSCAACGNTSKIESIRRLLMGRTPQTSRDVTIVGLSVDADVDAGLNLLRLYGPFDEIAIGSGWSNTLALKYIWPDSAPWSIVPQLVVIERRLAADDSSGAISHSERVIQRALGLDGIISWLERNFEP